MSDGSWNRHAPPGNDARFARGVYFSWDAPGVQPRGAVELRVFSTGEAAATGLFATPQGPVQALKLGPRAGGGYALDEDPSRGRVKWQVNRFATR